MAIVFVLSVIACVCPLKYYGIEALSARLSCPNQPIRCREWGGVYRNMFMQPKFRAAWSGCWCTSSIACPRLWFFLLRKGTGSVPECLVGFDSQSTTSSHPLARFDLVVERSRSTPLIAGDWHVTSALTPGNSPSRPRPPSRCRCRPRPCRPLGRVPRRPSPRARRAAPARGRALPAVRTRRPRRSGS